MSTFDGKVIEFPDIRIDYFRVAQDEPRAPLAFFLSHVHTDHLVGLDACKSPFIYCSPATREILLRLERYPHRINFAKGILESRKQTYRHLKHLLKPIPFETPTVLELAPNRSIRVTLFDANHCVGAAMFLIEDTNRAVLYTGDIRSEQWWVDSLARHPLLIPYSSHNGQAPIKKLDCMYLDTTCASMAKQCHTFPSKCDGIAELLSAVSQYPESTSFYFDSWTFGYEDVWLALSTFLKTQIHVDDYRYGVYSALARGTGPKPDELHYLMGYSCGNHFKEGCLTREDTRLHSCEAGTGCEIFNRELVRITPIISRFAGLEIPELGAGGGHGDLNQQHELELGDSATIQKLIDVCRQRLHEQKQDPEPASELLRSLLKQPTTAIPLETAALHTGQNETELTSVDSHDLPIEALIPAVVQYVRQKQERLQQRQPFKEKRSHSKALRPDGLPKQITFPYSRHSSYSELCMLVEAFKPDDIYPCTVDEAHWTRQDSMESLFGHLCAHGKRHRHDQKMLKRKRQDVDERRYENAKGDVNLASAIPQSPAQEISISPDQSDAAFTGKPDTIYESAQTSRIPQTAETHSDINTAADQVPDAQRPQQPIPLRNHQEMSPSCIPSNVSSAPSKARDAIGQPSERRVLSPTAARAAMQHEAHEAALHLGGRTWSDIGLISVLGHTRTDEEL